jgi:hypothetical protein
MWLPTPVYERIPQFYVLLGMLFFANGLYLGVEFDITLYYLGAGITSFLYGIGVFMTRLIHRQRQSLVSSAPRRNNPTERDLHWAAFSRLILHANSN